METKLKLVVVHVFLRSAKVDPGRGDYPDNSSPFTHVDLHDCLPHV